MCRRQPPQGKEEGEGEAEGEEEDLPIAGERPSFDNHVKLLLPFTKKWSEPILLDIADVVDYDI